MFWQGSCVFTILIIADFIVANCKCLQLMVAKHSSNTVQAIQNDDTPKSLAASTCNIIS